MKLEQNSMSRRNTSPQQIRRKSLKRKTKETEETCKLSIGELQRLVFNEQLQLFVYTWKGKKSICKKINWGRKREELEIQKLEGERGAIVVATEGNAENGDSTEFNLNNFVVFQ